MQQHPLQESGGACGEYCVALVQTYQLLNSDDHVKYLMRHDRDPADYRPDIVHQVCTQWRRRRRRLRR